MQFLVNGSSSAHPLYIITLVLLEIDRCNIIKFYQLYYTYYFTKYWNYIQPVLSISEGCICDVIHVLKSAKQSFWLKMLYHFSPKSLKIGSLRSVLVPFSYLSTQLFYVFERNFTRIKVFFYQYSIFIRSYGLLDKVHANVIITDSTRFLHYNKPIHTNILKWMWFCYYHFRLLLKNIQNRCFCIDSFSADNRVYKI